MDTGLGYRRNRCFIHDDLDDLEGIDDLVTTLFRNLRFSKGSVFALIISKRLPGPSSKVWWIGISPLTVEGPNSHSPMQDRVCKSPTCSAPMEISLWLWSLSDSTWSKLRHRKCCATIRWSQMDYSESASQ